MTVSRLKYTQLGKTNLLGRRVFMTLRDAKEGVEHIVVQVNTDDDELNSFLFSLGCYSGEPITVIAHRRSGCTVSIKDSRYSFDKNLAGAIEIK